MTKKKAAAPAPETQKPTFDMDDFLPENNVELPENPDYGDELSDEHVAPAPGDELELEDVPAEEEPEDEPEEEPEDEPAEEEPTEEEPTEEEPEDEPTEEEPTEEEPEDDADKGKKPNYMVPKRRLDSQIAKTRQLQDQIKQLQKETQDARRQAAEKEKVPDTQIREWLQTASQKALDGETEAAAELQQKAFDAMATNKGEPREEQASVDPDDLVAQVEERTEAKFAVKKVFEDYPMLDPNAEQFDEALNEEVLEFHDYYLSKGYAPAAAIEKSVDVIAKTHGLESTSAPKPKPKPKVRSTKPDVRKKIEAANAQPPEPTSRRGNRAAAEETVDINTLTDEALLALPESVRARMRGDM